MQFASWNTQGKPWNSTLQILEDACVDAHVIALQECNNPKGDVADEDISLMRDLQCRVLHGYMVLSGHPPGCHRQLAFCLEDSDEVSAGKFDVGFCHISLCVNLVRRPMLFLNVHLPHSGRPLSDLQQACESVVTSVARQVQQGMPIILLGDLNFDLHHDETGSDRGLLVCSMLEALGTTVLSDNRGSTWRHRTIDYVLSNNVYCNQAANVGEDGAAPWADYTVRHDVQKMLGVDHACVIAETLMNATKDPLLAVRRRQLWSRMPRKMVVTSPEVVQCWAHEPRTDGPLDQRLQRLRDLAAVASSPQCSLRYKDPAPVRALCRNRSACPDPAVRKQLSFDIAKSRQDAKAKWRTWLVHQAASGNWRARRLLLKKTVLAVGAVADGCPSPWEYDASGPGG